LWRNKDVYELTTVYTGRLFLSRGTSAVKLLSPVIVHKQSICLGSYLGCRSRWLNMDWWSYCSV